MNRRQVESHRGRNCDHPRPRPCDRNRTRTNRLTALGTLCRKSIFLLAAVALFASCDVDIHTGDENGYFRAWGDRYPLRTAVQYYPPVDATRQSDLVRVVFGTPWENDEPGIELLLWTPPDEGLAAGGYVWDPFTTKPFGIADGWAWGEDRDWRRRVMDGRIDVRRWGPASCTVDFDLLLDGGVFLTGHYSGELLER